MVATPRVCLGKQPYSTATARLRTLRATAGDTSFQHYPGPKARGVCPPASLTNLPKSAQTLHPPESVAGGTKGPRAQSGLVDIFHLKTVSYSLSQRNDLRPPSSANRDRASGQWTADGRPPQRHGPPNRTRLAPQRRLSAPHGRRPRAPVRNWGWDR